VLLIGGGLLVLRLRQRPQTAALSPEDEARLAQLTREGPV
jgi:cytochrome c-type biogenesis protein CcmH/NrfF